MSLLPSTLDAVFVTWPTTPSACITSSSGANLLVQDDVSANCCQFANPTGLSKNAIEQDYFQAFNPQLRSIYLWAIDGCFMLAHENTRCDCVLFSGTDFCFIEFKLNAASSKPSQIKRNRNKAIQQLRTTILFIRNATIGNPVFDTLQYEAYVCSPPHYPSKTTSLSKQRIDFLEQFGVMLFESGKKQFG